MLPPLLEPPRLRLRPVRATDAAAIFHGYAQDEEVTRDVMWRPHQTIAEAAEAFVATALAKPDDTARTYAVCNQADVLLGLLDLRFIRRHYVY